MSADEKIGLNWMIVEIDRRSPHCPPAGMSNKDRNRIIKHTHQLPIPRRFHKTTGRNGIFQNLPRPIFIPYINTCGITSTSLIQQKQLCKYAGKSFQLFPCSALLSQYQTTLTAHITQPLVRVYAYDWRSLACFPKENAAWFYIRHRLHQSARGEPAYHTWQIPD